MDKNRIIDYLAALSDAEFAALSAEARATPEPTPAERLRAAEAAGDWRAAFAIKAAQLGALMNPKPKD